MEIEREVSQDRYNVTHLQQNALGEMGMGKKFASNRCQVHLCSWSRWVGGLWGSYVPIEKEMSRQKNIKEMSLFRPKT